MLRGDPAPVGDGDLDRAVPAPGRDRHAASVRREADGVVDEVEQHLVHALTVGGERRQVGRDVVADVDPAPGERDVDLGDQVVDEGLERQGLDAERDLARLQRDRSRSWSTSRPRRSTCASITPSVAGSGCSTPSSRFSR